MLLRRIGFFFFYFLALLALLYSGDKIYLYLLSALSLIILLSLLQLLLSCLSFSLQTTLSETECEKEQPFTWFLYPRAGLFPIAYAKIITEIPDSLSGNAKHEEYSASIAHHTAYEIPISLAYDYTGKYFFSIHKVILSDIFGLFSYSFRSKSKHFPEAISVLVLPDVKAFPYPSESMDNQSEIIKTNDRNEPAGIREYMRGDQMNRIHWKYTARTGKLHVKEYEKYTRDTHIIYIDMTNPDLHGIKYNIIKDLLLSRVASLCAKLVSNGSSVILFCYQEESSSLISRTFRDKDDIRRFLANCQFIRSSAQTFFDPFSSVMLTDKTDFSIFSAGNTIQAYEDIAKSALFLTSVTIYLIPQREHLDEQKSLVHALSDQGYSATLLTDDTTCVRGGSL